jgi:LysR family transcriptional activator of dmlA
MPIRDPHSLLPFIQAVRCGSFIAAAARLQVTPPAVSKSIAKLERELGMRLFNRTTRKLHLTSEGRELFERVSPLLTALDETIVSITRGPQEPEGLVRVSTTPTFGRYCLMPILADFFKRHPRIELDISFDEHPPSLVADGFDVSIQHVRGRGTSHVARLLCDYPIVLVASPDYLARKGTPVVPEDLAHHDCIAVRQSLGKVALHLERIRSEPGTQGRKRGEHFLHNMRGPLTVANQLDASLLAALYGAGITASSVPVVLPYLKSQRLKLVLPDYRVKDRPANHASPQIYIHYPHHRHLPAKVRVLVDFFLERLHYTRNSPEELDVFAASTSRKRSPRP